MKLSYLLYCLLLSTTPMYSFSLHKSWASLNALFCTKQKQNPWEDVIGKEELMALAHEIKNSLQDPTKKASEIENLLLVGATQTGKTFWAQALCSYLRHISNETIVTISFTKAEAIAAGGLSNIFKWAAKFTTPCVIFLDDLDLYNQSKIDTAEENLVTELYSLKKESNNKVMVIAATNEPDLLDYAIIKCNYFPRKISFNYPSYEQRKEALAKEFKRHNIQMQWFTAKPLTKEETSEFIAKLAETTAGLSFNGISNLITTALTYADKAGRAPSYKDFDKTIRIQRLD